MPVFIYHYKPPESLSKFSNPVMFWRGSEEPIPKKVKDIKEVSSANEDRSI